MLLTKILKTYIFHCKIHIIIHMLFINLIKFKQFFHINNHIFLLILIYILILILFLFF